MKHSKPGNSLTNKARPSQLEISSVSQYREFQRLVTSVLFRPLTAKNRMQPLWIDGRRTKDVIEEFVKPNDRLTSFQRLEIYNRQYWFRVLDSLYEDFPALRAVLGQRRFVKMAETYLVKYPSASFTMRNLGSRLETFLHQEPHWAGRKQALALEVARFEWAQIVAFDSEAKPPLGAAELLPTHPKRLKLGLQPYLTLLALECPVDNFVLAVKKHEALRGEASNAMDAAPKLARLNRVPLPRPKKTYVAIHRHSNALYYKRLEPEAFALLSALREGKTLARACDRAFRRASPEVKWEKRIEKWFENWSALGWFCRPE
jgi:hypothetical protein